MNARHVALGIIALCVIGLLPVTSAAQAPAQGRGNPNPLRTVTRTTYTPKTEGIVRYSKENGWDGRFATAPVAKVSLGSGKVATIAVPKNAVVENNGQSYLYVQRDPKLPRK